MNLNFDDGNKWLAVSDLGKETWQSNGKKKWTIRFLFLRSKETTLDRKRWHLSHLTWFVSFTNPVSERRSNVAIYRIQIIHIWFKTRTLELLNNYCIYTLTSSIDQISWLQSSETRKSVPMAACKVVSFFSTNGRSFPEYKLLTIQLLGCNK